MVNKVAYENHTQSYQDNFVTAGNEVEYNKAYSANFSIRFNSLKKLTFTVPNSSFGEDRDSI